MKILVLADTDEVMGTWEGGDAKADVLVACGDIQTSLILEAAKACRCRSVFAVKGNHDDAAPFPHPIQDLHMDCADHDGLTFGGFGGCIRYKPRGAHMYEQEEVSKLMATFPRTDVFVAHNSPLGIHDQGDGGWADGAHIGFSAFNGYISRHQPKVFFHGHHHKERETLCGKTRVIGVFVRGVFEI